MRIERLSCLIVRMAEWVIAIVAIDNEHNCREIKGHVTQVIEYRQTLSYMCYVHSEASSIALLIMC